MRPSAPFAPNSVDRAVFDTIVFVGGLINPRGSWGHLVDRAIGNWMVGAASVLAKPVPVLQRPEVVPKHRVLMLKEY